MKQSAKGKSPAAHCAARFSAIAGQAMKATFRKSFARDVKKIKNQNILKRVQQAIENVEAASSLDEISHLKNWSVPRTSIGFGLASTESES